jgi:formate dehydrogenase major subunit
VLPDGTDTEVLHIGEFKRGKGKFEVATWRETEEILNHGRDFPYILTTNRELEHYNCGTMTRRTGNVEILTDDVLLIHPEDAERHLIREGDMVCVISPRGKIDIKARITDEVRPGVLSSTFHFPEVRMNDLTSSVSDSEAMCPEYKVVAVNIRKSKGQYKTNPQRTVDA